MLQAYARTRHAWANGPFLMSAAAAFGGAAVGGIASLAGGVFGASSASKDAAKQRKFAKKEAKKTRAHQTKLYSRRYRRTVADMKAAGLNPILAYKQGAGGTPGGGGAMATSSLGQSGQAGIAGATAGAAKGIEAVIASWTAKKIEQDTKTSAAQEANVIKKTEQLDINEPYAKIMRMIANEGIEPLMGWLRDNIFNNADKGSKGAPRIGDKFPAREPLRNLEKVIPEFPPNWYQQYDRYEKSRGRHKTNERRKHR